MQTQMRLDTLKLIQDVRTRWNSTFYMLERLLKLKVPLSATLPLLDSPQENLTANEWLLVEDMVVILHPVEMVTKVGQQTPYYASAASLIKQYVELPYLERKSDPLQFWNEKKIVFPMLYSYKLVKEYLCIPATSVPSERLFSKAGLICNDRRNRLYLPKKK